MSATKPKKPAPPGWPTANLPNSKRPRGKPSQFTEADRDNARLLLLAGESRAEVARRIGCQPQTITAWSQRYGWADELEVRRNTAAAIEAQIARLASKKPTASVVDQLAKATKALERMRRAAPRPKPRPSVRNAVARDLLDRCLAPEYGLHQYQRDYVASDDRFECILKARQTGFSYAIGLRALLGAAAGRDQLIISASERQAQQCLRYARLHAERLDVPPEDDGKSSTQMQIRGGIIRALPANYRTVQGFAGDVYLDEFAWVHKQQRLWDAVVPSITQIGGRVSVCSTPFVPGSLFWKLAENHDGRWGQFRRWRLSIHDAIAQGMPLPGGLDELRGLFDSDSWAMLYECQWAEDGTALLPWTLLHDLATVEETRLWPAPVDAGVDVGQANDRFVLAVIGQEAPDITRLLWYLSEKGLEFAAMEGHCRDLHRRYTVGRMAIDRTGIGRDLAERLTTAHPNSVIGRDFSRPMKERLALNLLKLAEERRLRLPNDPYLLSRLHAVKRHVSASGIRYDAAHDQDGHADEFWALALACDGRGKVRGADDGVQVIVL